jgi:hypothetical protein
MSCTEKRLKQYLQDLEALYQKALESDQLSVALKAKELMLKMEKPNCPKKHWPEKPLQQWSEAEVEELLKWMDDEPAQKNAKKKK